MPAFTKVACPTCQNPVHVPRRFANYLLEELIGRGRLCDVYRALDTTLDRDIVVKIVRTPAAEDPGLTLRFLAAAKKAAVLTNPRVVPIFSCGEADGQAYQVMQYMERSSLARRLHEAGGSGLPMEQAMDIAIKAAAGLEAAVQRGICHGHVSAENLLFDGENFPKVADFGLAGAAWCDGEELPANLTRAFADFRFAAPERLDSGTADVKSDLFSFGVLLYEMLTGKTPWSGNTPDEIRAARSQGPPPSPDTLRPLISAAVSRMVMATLELDPSCRPAGYGEVMDVLEDAHKSHKGKRVVTMNKPGRNRLSRAAAPVVVPGEARAFVRRSLVRIYLELGIVLLLLLLLGLFITAAIMRAPWFVNGVEPRVRPVMESLLGGSRAEFVPAKPAAVTNSLAELPDLPDLPSLMAESGGGVQEAGLAAVTGTVAVAVSRPPTVIDTAVTVNPAAPLAPVRPLPDEFAAKRPQPADLVFVPVAAVVRSYIQSVPAEWRATEEQQFRLIEHMRRYLVSWMRIAYEDPAHGIELRDGRVLSGTVILANENELHVRTSEGRVIRIRWDSLTFGQFRAFFDYYIQVRKQRAGATLGKDVGADYLRLALLCDWYGQRREARQFGALAAKNDPELAAQVTRLLPPLTAVTAAKTP